MRESPQHVIDRLREFQRAVRDMIVASRKQPSMHAVTRHTAADTIYQIDTAVDPLLEDFCREWGSSTPLVLVAEGIENEEGIEGIKTFPPGLPEDKAEIRVLVDPIDGTRGIMYDKRAAWALAGVAPNHGAQTCLSDIEVAVMTELPTSKMGFADVCSAVRGAGAHALRIDLANGASQPLPIKPSTAESIEHGFASVANFFPGTKMLASGLMEHIARHLVGEADVTRATVFDDQYISTAGQLYELIVGHDRFNADLRPLFYRMQNQPAGLCCHPYDCATLLIATEAGVIVTNEKGQPLDGPFDVTTGLCWIGYANAQLRGRIEPHIVNFINHYRSAHT
jgi:hypothetical protein